MSEMRCRKTGLLIDCGKCKTCESLGYCTNQDKIYATKSQNNALNENKILHFGVWLTKSNQLNISKDHYATIDKQNSFVNKEKRPRQYLYDLNPSQYEDESCTIYSDAYCTQHQKACFENYDINMDRFKQIPRDRFEGVVNYLITAAPFQKIEDLTRCNYCGLYIMVLDRYKQIYIGVAQNIKDRIKKHWYAKKKFDRLIFGTVEHSVISIDSFGALDTTRIYILPMPFQNLREAEAGFVNSINPMYTLNRVNGGLDSETAALLSRRRASKWNDDIVDFITLPKKKDKKPIREKNKRSIEYRYYTKGENIDIDNVSIGEIVCIEHNEHIHWGKVKKTSPSYITLCEYGTGNDLKVSILQIEKQEKSYYSTKRFSTKCIKNIAKTNVTITQKDKSFYRIASYKKCELWE